MEGEENARHLLCEEVKNTEAGEGDIPRASWSNIFHTGPPLGSLLQPGEGRGAILTQD